MMVSRRRLLLAGAAAVLGGGAYAAGRYTMRGTPAVYRGPIVVATGATKGVYYQYGVEFAAAAGPALGTVTLRTTTGSVDNLDLLARGLGA